MQRLKRICALPPLHLPPLNHSCQSIPHLLCADIGKQVRGWGAVGGGVIFQGETRQAR